MKGPFGDIKSARLIHLKGWLFLVLALIAGIALVLPVFSWQNLVLLLICVWAGCRWYYYLFYVIEHYIDPGFKFSSILDALRYLLKTKNQ